MRKALLKLANDIEKNEFFYKNVMSMLDKHFISYGGSIDNDFINLDVDELEGLVNPDKVLGGIDIDEIGTDLRED